MTTISRNFQRFAWGALGYMLLVILWGAYVRATGSGAGCGEHWPLCNGEVIPRAPAIETIIEFSHRLSSGVALLLVLVLWLWAWRRLSHRHLVTKAALISFVVIIIEALLGAGLVIFKLVAEDTSVARGYSAALHLVNTLFLLAALTLTVWWASGGAPIKLKQRPSMLTFAAGLGVLGMLLSGMTGAIAALGNTLFPAESLRDGIAQDFSSTAHLFIQLRILHPMITILTGSILFFLAAKLRQTQALTTRRLAVAVMLLVAIQFSLGFLNLALLAPIWLQLAHLLVADLLWISFILLLACQFSQVLQHQVPVKEVMP